MSNRPILSLQHPQAVHLSDKVLLDLISELLNLKKEIEERYPEYFEYQSLRCLTPAGIHWQLAGGESISFSQLCEWIGIACDLNLVSVADRSALNAIDLLFTTRVEALEIFSAANAVPTLFDLPFADEESAVSVLTDLRRKLEIRLNHRLLRASNLQAEMQPKIIERNGSPLTYFAAGGATGTPIVLINALAQGF